MLAAKDERRSQLEHGAGGPLGARQHRVALRKLIHEASRPLPAERTARIQHFEAEQQAGAAHLAKAGVARAQCPKLRAQVAPGGARIRHQLLPVERIEHRKTGGSSDWISTESREKSVS